MSDYKSGRCNLSINPHSGKGGHMADLVYKVQLSETAEIWAKKHACMAALSALTAEILAVLQNGDLLELEFAEDRSAVFSVLRKTMRVTLQGQATVSLFLDHPAR